MIVKLFKTNQASGLIFLLLFQVLIYLNAFIHPQIPSAPVNLPVFYQFFVGTWVNFPFISVIFSFVLITTQALLFNSFMVQTGILGKPTYMPAFFYVLICSLLPENLYTNPATIANLFVIFGLMSAWKISQKSASVPTIFTGAFLLSIGAHIYPPLLLLLIWFLVALFVLSNASVKEVLVLLVGFCIPYIYTFTAYYWLISPHAFVAHFFIIPFGLPDYSLQFSITEYILYAVVILTMGLSYYHYITITHFYKVVQKRMFQVCVYLLLAILVSGAFYNLFQKHHLILLASPLSVFLSFYSLQKKKTWLADLIIITVFVLMIILQFDYY
jgi:hypothetical protein